MNEKLKGMTVNERLWFLQLSDAYDNAVATQNETKLREVLTRCEIGDDNLSAIVAQKMRKEQGAT